ncbi:DUF2062 domain-containing protein [Larsenimonas rhizosphaerae]|uniref:DUF2062 domain-containing protein n=1 Tax=Larsenimonas rhizosphaerae TaxID=2944682 RepID=A0AA42CTV9_9GAMM|nr:DUF2062 domain-containing protein [Larsenimonas rhizosphaerae]MCM2130979.1 DUF2062 domain-containing protein [Larsenimonas rhizosphaerae]MCX2523684.1 DUF2062 domain-containing protein [Larsenimonas rhizosphaerae]
MPRRLINRFLPDPETLQNKKSLRCVSHFIANPALWQVSRRTIGNAFMVGIFCAFMPIPAQMLVAAVGAWLFRCNLPLSVVLVWITNPLTMPVIFYGTYRVGTWVLNTPPRTLPDHFTAQWIAEQLADILPPLLTGSLISGVVIGVTTNILIRLLWRWHVSRQWKRRQRRRRTHIKKSA